MSLWSAAIGFLTGTPKMTTDIFDKDSGLLSKAGGFLNDLHHSDAEKARDVLKIGEAVTKHVESTLSESTERSQTRRAIAILWIKVQLGLILMTAICIPFNDRMAEKFFKLATSQVMLGGTISIIIFFFGAYGYGMHMKKKG